MSSIIVLDSSDEEADSANKKPRIGPPVRGNQVQATQSMARVNPLKASTTSTAAKKTVAASASDIRIHLPTKRATPTDTSSVDQVPKKRVKPTTVVHSSDEEWINRQKNGEQLRINPPSAALNKFMVGSAKTPVSVVKNPILIGSSPRQLQNSTRVTTNAAAAVNNTKPASQSYVRVAMNGKDLKPASPPVTSKNLITTLKEQSKASISPPIINKNITATVKDQTKSVPLSQQTFKNSVTIRRVVVGDDRSKTSPVPKPASNAISKVDQATKMPLTGINSTSIRRIPLPVDPLKTPMPSTISTKHLNTSSLKITPIPSSSSALSTSSTSIKRIPSNSECVKVTQSMQVLKRNSNAAKPTVPNNASTSASVNSNPISGGAITYTPATIKRIVTVDLPKTPASPPVITKNYSTGPKKSANEVPKTSMSMSVITKNHVKASEPKMSPPVLPKSLSMPTRPSGLIVTPITCAAATTCTASTKTTRAEPNPTRAATKQTKPPPNRPRPSPISTDQSMASMPTSMFNMYPSMGGFMGNSSMMYGVDPSSGSFVNSAFLANRPMNALESVLPSMSPSVYNMNQYPSFSGGSITPIKSPGTAPSPTFSTGRSSKSPVTSTVTRSSGNAKSPAALMGIPIDVDQPLRPMSPTVYNMNHHPPFNGDPFGMRGTSNIPSPAYSPVRSTKSPISSGSVTKAGGSGNPSSETGRKATSSSSPVCYRDLDNFVRNPLSYPSNAPASTPATGNGPIISLDSPVRNHSTGYGPSSFFKSPTSTITSPAHSTISDGSSVSEVLPTNGDISNPKSASDKPNVEPVKDAKTENAENTSKEEEVKQPLNEEYKKLLDVCREADSSEDMNKLIESKLIRYYYSVHPDFVKSRGFRKAVVAATESIKKNPDLVYYHLRPVVEEMKARKKCKTVVMTNDESTEAAPSEAPVKDQSIEDKVRNRQIRKLSKGLYILTRKIHKLENEDVDLDDENSSYLIVERYKKRACEIYDKICDLTGESKHALRQVKKPITFKATDYPKFNKVVEAFVNRTKEFPDFLDVLKMLEFCNDRYKFNLHKEEMTMIAQDAFIKIGKLLQSRRKADLYETVSHFTSDYEDPAANDPALLAKLSENDKNQTSIGSIIDKYAREQVRRKAESANASGDDVNNSSESCETEGQSHDEDEASNENNNCVKKDDKECEKPTGETTNGKHTPPQSPQIISSSSPSPSASTSAPFRISPPHAFASPQASPRPRSSSPLLPPPPPPPSTQAQSQSPPASSATVTIASTTTAAVSAAGSSEQQTQTWATNLLKILSVTSLNDSAAAGDIVMNKPTASLVDEIIISDEDL